MMWKCKATINLWVLLAWGAQSGVAQAQAPRGDQKADLELWTRFQKQEAPLLKTEPQAVVADYLEFLRAGAKSSPPLNAAVAIDAWDETIDLVARKAKDPEKALALCDEALALYGQEPRAANLLAAKMRVLVYEGRNAEAEAFAGANGPQVAQAPVSLARRIVWYQCLALQAQGKSAEIPAILEKIMAQNALLLDEEYQSTNGWMYRYLIKGLLAQGKTDEALSWAKLRWMECAFDDSHVQGAASLLVQVWGTQDGDKTPTQNVTRFIAAQRDVPVATAGAEAVPSSNPLSAVAVPVIEPQELQKQLERLSSAAGDVLHEQNTHGRINLLILAGDWGRAMSEANELWMAPPTSARGIKEITRVYKAHDLSLTRANAFLDWVGVNQGPNPVEQFLVENPVGEKPAGVGGAT